MTNFAYKALDARGAQAAGEIEGESKAAVAAALRSSRPHRARPQRGQAGVGPVSRSAAASSPRTSPSSRASSRPWSTPGSPCCAACTSSRSRRPTRSSPRRVERRPRRRRGRHQPLGRAREAPQDLQPALRQHGPRRRARRHPRRGAQPPRHPARERRRQPSAGPSSRRWSTRSSSAAFAIIVLIGMVLFLIPDLRRTCTRTSATPSCRSSRAS